MSTSSSSTTGSPTKSPHHNHHRDYKGFFKRHFSLNKKQEEQEGTQPQESSTRNINEDMANLSLHTDTNNTISLVNPGHSDPTVQHTDHVLTPKTEEVPMDSSGVVNTVTDETALDNTASNTAPATTLDDDDDDDDNDNDNDNNNDNDNPTIMSLKQNLLDTTDTTMTPAASVNSTSGSMYNNHITIPHSAGTTVDDNIINGTPYGKKQSHPYQYEYFPLTSDKNSNSIDEDAGVLQNEDKLINQAIFQNVVKRDMKRKRNDSMSSGNIGSSKLGMTSSKETKREPVMESTTPKEKQKISATAAIMMKLYNNDAQIKNDKANEVYKRDNSLNTNNNNSDVDFKESLRRRQEVDAIKKSEQIEISQTNPSTTLENEKLKIKKTITSESSYSSETDSYMDEDEEDVEVILKWRDQISDIADIKIYVISKEIVSTLLAVHPHYEMHDIDKKECRLHMIYDPKQKEWFLPGLCLPPGIYRFQFSINGNLTHSNYLPTATNTLGSVVNWFEVLPGYGQIEPYRDYDKINSSSVNLHDDNSKNNAQRTYSTASLTDYAGISRSNSMINKSSGSTLRIANYFNALQPLTPKEPAYSNEIPELFKFDTDLTGTLSQPVDVSAPFDMTLSKVVECNQDELFANMQRVAKMNADEAEKFFLTKFKVAELPVYLNSNYLNKNFNNEVNHIIPHVNLNHLLTSSIKDEIICVGCTTRYAGKFITQVMYAPCSSKSDSQ
ncbi:similar to Saccharomyces cerevisiae YDR422C SIP1 Alternate beta-subunit of the Snf1p kinase complex, may confer substrate specificity [Maudiozyma barnettii]|mgnify:CR=1 FL=1|uniref:Similar to Saccharomyces cerevisiae YDR422C SIP1 Alternate beta-subunit of the Snf1p kinase complex, may confer substrate specificity n=1 Tax=Maudiozyma barnettii TaxID=61262 RepID=A0A8H2ZGJ1_9SACH|nr:Sip1p [Kazachstania barnettii]CAB4253703.1 similar to Saccharomyces cerevisiae YDR422C SIP1 Alternate beta-subunit of the Snf1p kinase complex, may confer substrate specificity [Kazachstania barnettii]CAD1781436.1 similar to Saccharomyces cerevisiae YDR422C SIP1 Alternate beta-subunit of the Snf1p kinase complex, may confer substrate specificity [Kazachstania barnettii]